MIEILVSQVCAAGTREGHLNDQQVDSSGRGAGVRARVAQQATGPEYLRRVMPAQVGRRLAVRHRGTDAAASFPASDPTGSFDAEQIGLSAGLQIEAQRLRQLRHENVRILVDLDGRGGS